MNYTASHVLPQGSLHIDQMKEQISVAYAHMVGTAAGLTTGRWDTDMDGVDLSLKSSVEYTTVSAAVLDLQMKCTSSSWRDKGSHYIYPVSAKVYKKLTNPKRHSQAIFCLTVVPDDATKWLKKDVSGLLAHAHTYWLAARDFPLLPDGQDSVTLHIPKENELTPAQLLNMIKDLYGTEEMQHADA